jgi:hypothetical protein
MRIDFLTSTGKPIGSVTLLQFVVSWAALLTILTFAFTSGETFFQWFCELSQALAAYSPNETNENAGALNSIGTFFLSKWFVAIKILAAAIAFTLASIRLAKGSWLSAIWWLNQNMLLALRLAASKLKTEAKRFPCTSEENFLAEIQSAKTDAVSLAEAAASQVITNATTQEITWASSVAIEAISKIPLNQNGLKANIDSLAERLTGLAQSELAKKIRFYVSPVQPTILFCVEQIIKQAKIEQFVEVNSSSWTGPRTVRGAVLGIRDRPEGEASDEIRMFSAPLSAYVMYDHQDPETNTPNISLKDHFECLGVVAKEPQEILLLDDRRRIPVRKGRFLYYNNSTAEECWARLDPSIHTLFERTPVDNYDHYLAYLRGGTPSVGQMPLLPGDAIVTWPPLTSFFDGKSVGKAYYASEALFGASAHVDSRILLFREKFDETETENVKEFAGTFTHAMILALYRLHLDSGRLNLNLVDGWRKFVFSRRYAVMNKGLLGVR